MQFLQLGLGTDIDFRLQKRQRLEELFLHTGLRRLGDVHHERQSSVRLGEHIHDHSRLAVLDGMKDYGLSLCQHTTAKVQ